MSASDAILVSEFLRGDQAAFGQIVERYRSMTCAIAYSLLGDVGLSEDAAQEAFLVAWRNLRELRDPDQLRGWLAGIVRNTARAALRRRPVAPLEHDPPACSESPADSAARRDEAALIWDTLRQLPDSYREPLVLYYRQDRSVKEVALTMNISEDAAKQRLARGRELLKGALADRVEVVLRRTAPSAAFTSGVLGMLHATAGPAAAAGGAATAGAAGAGATGAMFGIFGGALGSVLGVAGGIIGTACSIRNTKTPAERAFMIKCAWVMWLTITAWVGLFLFVAFTQSWLFTSVWFQLAYWTTHVVGLTTAIILCNRRAAELRALPPTDAARP